jgi:hypothetical protein
LKIVFFILLKGQLHKFQDQFTIFNFLTSAPGRSHCIAWSLARIAMWSFTGYYWDWFEELSGCNPAYPIQHIHVGNSEFSSIVCQINNILLLNPNFLVRFVKRQANIIAHSLAKATISWSRRALDSLPLCIAILLYNKMI